MTLVYSVPGISCDHCKQTIEAATGAVDGVGAVSVDVAKKSVRVEGSAAESDVRAAISEAGYEVESVAEE
jgi:copper ion binding protein